MPNFELIATLTGGFVMALTFGYVTYRLGMSTIVGYLIAGILVGPYTPGFVADHHMAEQLAEVGVILLMFGVGLHFHLKDLMAVKGIAILGALVQSGVATGSGALAFHAMGWSWTQGVVFGLSLSVASTVVLIRVLSDSGSMHSATGRVAVGWLVMEDIFTVFVLVMLPVVFKPEAGASLGKELGLAAVKLAAFVGFTLVAGSKVIPWLLRKVAETHSRELFTLSVLAVALGIAAGSAYFFGVSMALGAFLAGMVVGQSEFSARAGGEALPLRDAFAVMFFLSVGMLFDPKAAMASPGFIAMATSIVLVGKPLAAVLIVSAMGYGSKVGFGVAMALAQVGEFSFLLASLGRDSGALPASAMNPLVASAIVSIMLSPLLYRSAAWWESTLQRFPRLWRLMNRASGLREVIAVEDKPAAHRAIVVGYGPTGRLVVGILKQLGIEAVVVEMNVDTHMRLRGEGQAAVHGDSNQREVLEQAGVAGACSLILSASGSGGFTEAVRTAREMNPKIHVVARAEFLKEAEVLRQAGAAAVFSGEGEVATAMAASILEHFGATPEQLDEAREQIRVTMQVAGG
jgi:CPA2 family monovalent cation:H+ antiporter-2